MLHNIQKNSRLSVRMRSSCHIRPLFYRHKLGAQDYCAPLKIEINSVRKIVVSAELERRDESRLYKSQIICTLF